MPRRGEPNADLDSVVSEISQQVRLLDGLVRYRFGGNAELIGAWANARNVQGPFRSHGGPAASGVTPAVVKPVAWVLTPWPPLPAGEGERSTEARWVEGLPAAPLVLSSRVLLGCDLRN